MHSTLRAGLVMSTIPKKAGRFWTCALVAVLLSGLHIQTQYAPSPVRFFYFSREYPTEKLPLTLDNCQELLEAKPIKCIIHGWEESSERAYFQAMTKAYLINQDVQVIQVDWKTLAHAPYVHAAIGTQIVGNQLAELLIKREAVDTNFFDLVHVIGHSLGAHAAGHAGKAIRRQTGRLLARITGLDAAGPYFNLDAVAGERLAAGDAALVDATHTDGGAFGLAMVFAHVDFFPNGGRRPQPGCEPFGIDLVQLEARFLPFCSHIKSYAYFIASISGRVAHATKCDSYDDFLRGACDSNERIVYGEHLDLHTSRGRFYFNISLRDKPDTLEANSTNAAAQMLLAFLH